MITKADKSGPFVQTYMTGLESVVIDQLMKARSSISIVMAWFTNQKIKDALVSAARHNPALDIGIVVDENDINTRYFFNSRTEMEKCGIRLSVNLDKRFLHRKFTISIDLDPSDEDFGKAIKVAQAAKSFFDKHQLISFVKTSGKTGIHLFLPCEGFDHVQARSLAEVICVVIAAAVPDIATTEVSIDHRGKKLFVDPSQNDYADTLASVYSVRPYKHPQVSTPLNWKEVKAALDPAKFTMDSIPERLEKKGDLFAGLADMKLRKANSKMLKAFLNKAPKSLQ